ncbi:hypothetical protein [Pseudoduganella lutea]|uniref:Uncharacterized protein n=1 Tax=Pseudoduganella lutea TaxID=321985 RepID=A0A4V0Z4A5_9BURK|nr:hypothetical protein [Pseudoduganella lutea]QBE66263.1 hypothetical protein EWM63_27510 [Pseudoduganella lutea]
MDILEMWKSASRGGRSMISPTMENKKGSTGCNGAVYSVDPPRSHNLFMAFTNGPIKAGKPSAVPFSCRRQPGADIAAPGATGAARSGAVGVAPAARHQFG